MHAGAFETLKMHEMGRLYFWLDSLQLIAPQLLRNASPVSRVETLLSEIGRLIPASDQMSQSDLELAICVYLGRIAYRDPMWFRDYLRGFRVIRERAATRKPPYNYVWLDERAGCHLTICCAIKSTRAVGDELTRTFVHMLEEFTGDRTINLILQNAGRSGEMPLLNSLIHGHGILAGLAECDFSTLTPWGRRCIRERFFSGSFNLTYYMKKGKPQLDSGTPATLDQSLAEKTIPELANALCDELAFHTSPRYTGDRFFVAKNLFREIKKAFVRLA